MSFFMSVSVLVLCPALHSVSDVMYMYVSMFHSLYMIIVHIFEVFEIEIV